jgi:hypothetical protein
VVNLKYKNMQNEIKISVFPLVKELKKDPETICFLLQEHLFKNFETSSEKGIITIKLPYDKETTT